MEELDWKKSRPLTLGVESELQIIDPETLDLSPRSMEIISHFNDERIKQEIFQSMLEICTGIAHSAHEVRSEFEEIHAKLNKRAEEIGVLISAAGSHPFAHHTMRILSDKDRYARLIERNKWIARRLQIFGMHIHIGAESGEVAIGLMNGLTPWMPVFLALSSSSPFMNGESTELASSRVTLFESMPTSGHPCTIESWDHYQDLYRDLIAAGAIESNKDLWWDIRPSPGYGTIELRICDGVTNLEELWSITALVHLVAARVYEDFQRGKRVEPQEQWIMRENKWRASLSGTEAALVWEEEAALPVATIVDQFLSENRELIDAYAYAEPIALVRDIARKGSSATRQRAVFASDASLKDVVRLQTREFSDGKPVRN